MSRAIEGVRVLDLSQGMAPAVAGMVLADHGAEVIKIEPPQGDPVRDLDGWLVWHRGKKSLVLDLEKPEGRDALLSLLPTADVLVESYQPGHMARWGLDYPRLHSRFPRLVYCSFTGYGQEGPDRMRSGRGELIEARLGLHHEMAGFREGPIYLGWPLAEYGGMFLLALGIVSALFARARTGKGQHVDASLKAGAAFLTGGRWGRAEKGSLQEPRRREASPNVILGNRRAVVGLFPCQDGEWIYVHTAPRGGFNRLMRCLGLHELADPAKDDEAQPSDMPPGMVKTLWDNIERIFLTRPRDEWFDMLRQADLAVMKAAPPGGCFTDEQLQANGLVIDVEDPEYGRVRQAGIAQIFGRTPGRVTASAPRLGQHTEAVLAAAGYTPSEIASLRRRGVVG